MHLGIALARGGGHVRGMITQKMKYALKALLVLADEAAAPVPQALTIEAIAKR